jgi:hypothetical protein
MEKPRGREVELHDSYEVIAKRWIVSGSEEEQDAHSSGVAVNQRALHLMGLVIPQLLTKPTDAFTGWNRSTATQHAKEQSQSYNLTHHILQQCFRAH